MAKIVKKADIEAALKSDKYSEELSRIRETYPENGDRGSLYELVGNIFHFIKAKSEKKRK